MDNMSEDDQFFDTRDEIASVSDLGSDGVKDFDHVAADCPPTSLGYDIWIKSPGSVHERRNKLLKLMGLLILDQCEVEDSQTGSLDEMEIDRISEDSGAVLRNSGFDDSPSSRQSSTSISCWSNGPRESFGEEMEDNFTCKIRNMDDGTEFVVDESEQDGMLGRIRKVGSNRLFRMDEFDRSLGLSPLVQQAMRRETDSACSSPVTRRKVKESLLRRLGVMACVVDKQVVEGTLQFDDCLTSFSNVNQMVNVRTYRKRYKEFSAQYMRQNIHAHEGSILTMEFSANGHYLASAGEDGIVRVWEVIESNWLDESDTFDLDPSYICFAMNNFSELVPVNTKQNKKGILNSFRQSRDSACVIFPQNVFQILEKPLHEFRGHSAEVLHIAWSKNKHLLSSSVDKTVRLWKVGCDQCLRVFYHNNYVTCVQFNPVDDNHFMSGSIDGKVRIWAISGCQVVDWTDITEIVTAVCYNPNGKGACVGSMSGICRFYDISDNRLQLSAEICLQGKKKSPLRRITGFQFSPSDPSKLMVTSADSKVRILQGVDVICKYRGIRNGGSQISASFTSDGKHIISASEDSNVYVWNDISYGVVPNQPKNHWSCERFFSHNVSVAIPWFGRQSNNSIESNLPETFSLRFGLENGSKDCQLGDNSQNKMHSLAHGFFSDSLPKNTATWPEEKLPGSNPLVVSSAMCKSHMKFLKTTCQARIGSSHTWGQVIVTAGWDGRIRTFQNYGLPIG